MTCLWQIGGRSNVPFDEWMRLDNAYIDGWSPLGDLAIVARTLPAVIRGDGAH
jgi:lipopolysaccharide/colanic/teichoic acid biosynthesis glycosyltransferase